MNLRSIIVCILALATLAGAIISGIAFTSLSENALPIAWLFNIAACLLVFMLGFTIKGGAHSTSMLLSIFAVCLPAVGPALAALVGTSIHFMRPVKEDNESFKLGNPLTSTISTGKPNAVLGRPLVEAVRLLTYPNMIRLLTGIDSIPPKDARPVLTRLRDGDDAQLQLFAQGCLNDPIESSEKHLKALQRRAQSHPNEAATHCAIAEINLYLLENNLIEEDNRPATWNAASHAIIAALKADPKDPLSLKTCARLNLIGGDPKKAELAANALAKIPGHQPSAQLLLAEVAYELGDLDSISEILLNITPGSIEQSNIVDFWRKPRPSAYA